MLFYKNMNIGVAKPSSSDTGKVPHHLMSFLDGNEKFSIEQFCENARKTIKIISDSNRLPLIVGGSGQYVWSLLEGWRIPEVPPNPQLRESLFQEAKERGGGALFERLKLADPEQASITDSRNIRRVVRALERVEAGAIGNHRKRAHTPPYKFLIIGLRVERSILHQRVRQRIVQMLENGWLHEVRQVMMQHEALVKAQYTQAIGYREMASHLQGLITLEEAINATCKATHRLIRSQNNWFKETDQRIHWVTDYDAAARVVSEWLDKNG